ncbi:MAG: hypothetical protein ACKOE2_14005 [Actinomycetales bacterium]
MTEPTGRRRAWDRPVDTIGQRPWIRFGAPGFLGSTLIAVGALGIGWLPVDTRLLELPLVEVLRGSTAATLTVLRGSGIRSGSGRMRS